MKRRMLCIRLQSGTKSPLFCVDGTFIFDRLAKYLGSEHPVYGLLVNAEVNRRYLKRQADSDLKELALYYVEHIKGIQEQGPYNLCGLCYGGSIAFHVAQELQLQGHTVANLILIESLGPKHRYSKRNLIQRLPDFLKHFKQLDFKGKATFIIYNIPQGIKRRVRRLFHIAIDKFRRFGTKSLNSDQIHPKICAGKAVLFLGKESTLSSYTSDPKFGWDEISNLDIRYVPGSHISVLKEPYIEVMASQIRVLLGE